MRAGESESAADVVSFVTCAEPKLECPRFRSAVETVAAELAAKSLGFPSHGTEAVLVFDDALGRTIDHVGYDVDTGELTVSIRRVTSAEHHAAQLMVDVAVLFGCSFGAVYVIRDIPHLSRAVPLAIAMVALFVIPMITRGMHVMLVRRLLERRASSIGDRVRRLAAPATASPYRGEAPEPRTTRRFEGRDSSGQIA